MKKVKLWFTGFWKSFDKKDNMFTQILSKKYELEITDDNPDFVICSPLGEVYEYIKFDCPRIMYTGEFLSADFNAIDYFIGYDDIQFGDRNFRFPLFLYNDNNGIYNDSNTLTKDEAYKLFKEKDLFCNYIFGHDTALGKREEILYELMKYKRVECAGRHLNNMPDNQTFTIRTKGELIKRCKFTIAAESVCYPGFTSEKIGDAFKSRTIPVYFGDPNVGQCFNSDAFVNCHNFENIESAVKRVIEIDQNDELFVKMLSTERYLEENYENRMYHALEEYLWRIFDQSKEEAYRRPRFYRAGWHETYLKEYNKFSRSIPHRILRKLGI